MRKPSMSRRQFVSTSLAAAATVAVAGAAQASPKTARRRRLRRRRREEAAREARDEEPAGKAIIDAHSHIWTRDTNSYPLAKGATVADLAPPSFTAEELMKAARPLGVGHAVLIAHHTYYGFDNTYMTDMAAKYPGVFRVVGMIDDQKPDPDVAMRRLLKQHVTGFRIRPSDGGNDWLSGPGMAAMWKCAAQTGQAMCCLIDARYLPTVDAMCKKNPETPVVIDHFARVGIDGAIHAAELKQLCHLARHKNTHVKVSAFYALGKKKPPYLDLAPMIRAVFDAYGPERLMWASDNPYQMQPPNTYAASLELVRDRLDFLSDGDRQWLLRKTAEKVFFA